MEHDGVYLQPDPENKGDFLVLDQDTNMIVGFLILLMNGNWMTSPHPYGDGESSGRLIFKRVFPRREPKPTTQSEMFEAELTDEENVYLTILA